MKTRDVVRAAARLAGIVLLGAADLAVIVGGLAIGFLVDDIGFILAAVGLLALVAFVSTYHRLNEERIVADRYYESAGVSARVPVPPPLAEHTVPTKIEAGMLRRNDSTFSQHVDQAMGLLVEPWPVQLGIIKPAAGDQ